MDNPFESGHIKNYILFYVSVVVIIVLFFIASSLFHDVQSVEKKVFEVENKETKKTENSAKDATKEAEKTPTFKLLEKAY